MPHRDNLLKIRTQFQTQIRCTSYVYQSFGWDLDFEIQRQATELGIERMLFTLPNEDPQQGMDVLAAYGEAIAPYIKEAMPA